MGSVHIEGLKAQTALLLFDTQGRLLVQKTANGNDMLDLSELPQGVYVLRITDGQENPTTCLIKQ